jgi:hypothetical protein
MLVEGYLQLQVSLSTESFAVCAGAIMVAKRAVAHIVVNVDIVASCGSVFHYFLARSVACIKQCKLAIIVMYCALMCVSEAVRQSFSL